MPPPTRSILRNVLSLSAGEFLSKAIGFVAVVYVGRVLGSAGLGVIGFATALLSYFVLLVNPGLDTVGIREIAAHPGQIQRTSTGILLARGILLLPGAVLLGLVLLVAPVSPTMRIVGLLYGTTLFLLPLTLDFYFMGTERMGVVAVRKTLQASLYLTGIVVFISHPTHIILVPLLLLASSAVSLLFQPIFVRGRLLRLDREVLRALPSLLRPALYVGGAQLLILTYLQIDLVMCGFLLPSEQVGFYTAAQRIAGAVALLPVVFLQAWMPELSRAEGDTEQRIVLERFFRVMALPGLLIAGSGFLIAPEALQFLFGNSYLDGSTALRLLFVSLGFVFLNMALANPLLAWKRDRDYFLIVLAGAGINVGLNAAFIPVMGIEGAAWATVAAEGTVLLFALRTQSRFLRPPHIKRYLRPLLPAVIATISAAALSAQLPGHPAGITGVFILIYAVVAFLQRDPQHDSAGIKDRKNSSQRTD
ncbi:MAG: flippase [Bacteroidetes bacterium]|nr:flippase [Bacteroidota bacterium]